MRLFTRFLTLLVVLLLPFYTFAAGTSAHAGLASPAKATSLAAQGAGSLTLNVFPNPGHGQVSIQLNAPVGQEYKFRLNNVLGREMRLLTLRPDLTAYAQALDVSNLPAGLYFYSLLVNDRVVSTNRLTLQ